MTPPNLLCVVIPKGSDVSAMHESLDETRLPLRAAPRPALEPSPIAFGQSLSFVDRDAILLRAPFFWPVNHESIGEEAGIYSGSIAIIEAAATQTLKAATVPRGLRPAAASRCACLRIFVDPYPLHLPTFCARDRAVAKRKRPPEGGLVSVDGKRRGGQALSTTSRIRLPSRAGSAFLAWFGTGNTSPYRCTCMRAWLAMFWRWV